MITTLEDKFRPRVKARIRKNKQILKKKVENLKDKLRPSIKARVRKNKQIVKKNVKNLFEWIKGAELVELKECNTTEDPVMVEKFMG